MSKLLWSLPLLALISVATTAVIVSHLVQNKVDGYGAQRIHLRDLSEKEKLQLLVYEETQLAGLSYQEYQVFKAVIFCESGWNPSAVSSTNDFGLAQINQLTWDNTARELGLDYKNSVRDNMKMAMWIYKNAGGIGNWVCSWTR